MPSQNEKSKKNVVVIGAGIMGLGTAFNLANRGFHVTVLEKEPDVAQVASYLNGTMICPSLAASWASLKIMSQNRGEVKKIKVSWEAWTDHKFWRWGMWFVFNSMYPGRVEQNHLAQRNLAKYTIKCLADLETKYGKMLDMNRTAVNTLRLFHTKESLDLFLKSSQAKFWLENGAPFKVLTPEECKAKIPKLETETEVTKDLVGGVVNEPGIDSSGDIYVFCKNLRTLCEKRGVRILTNAGVSKIAVHKGVVDHVELEDGGQVRGELYVMAAGIMSNPIGKAIGVNFPVFPLQGNVTTVETSEPLEYNVYSPKHGALVCPLKPNLVRISGGVHAVGYKNSLDEAGNEKNLQASEFVFKKGFLKTETKSFFSGLRPVCADDVAIIGQTRIPNLYAITGHGSKGWTYSFGSVELLGDLIEDKTPKIDPEPYSPLRFHPFRNFWRKLTE